MPTIADVTLQNVTIETPAEDITLILAQIDSVKTTVEQINDINADLRNDILALLSAHKTNVTTAINNNNGEIATVINGVKESLLTLINGLSADQLADVDNVLAVIEKAKNSDIQIVSTLDKTTDEVNALARPAELPIVTVNALQSDANGNYFEIAYPMTLADGKTIASGAMVAGTLTEKNVHFDRSFNDNVEVKKIDTSDDTKIKVYVSTSYTHFSKVDYDISKNWNGKSSFKVGLTFLRKLLDSEKINLYIPVLDSTAGTGTTTQNPVGSAN